MPVVYWYMTTLYLGDGGLYTGMPIESVGLLIVVIVLIVYLARRVCRWLHLIGPID